ncbi:hypothetical protein [Sedimentibacter sp. MB31-C6]|uniref:hypothetical protein n=1 Tax=Sedimentibacter sp. MB31-C6 TaxID=3109366 RepID=UPI002DDD9423|nr:hypothetical protein [Sedimentibacter sp. MB36-C1]WSI02989.1 hypothetical protein U8307_08000 [Sedimentibacter sp. MB36-C1]
MLAIRGRRKCTNCGKRYNWYYAKKEEDTKKVKYKGKNENASVASNVKILSANSCEITVYCPECEFEEKFIYND